MSQIAAPEPEWFSTWSNSLYHSRSFTKASIFIDALQDHLHSKPDAHILDLAGSEGQHALQSGERNYQVRRLELSAGSIAAVPQYIRLYFRVPDMRNPLPK
ncbi:hypothetical protein [Hymenobacter sp. YC55]|uniref:hypothetical protein n=1 Tax=Hymenobacter sp. YC55 TaxID=3034019 RepID=UPI0023F7AC6C|nr:hypothetical protein [Hymenobacter sp. YC55]MDF7812557.1 hypothetical protein [Hymenobacter sp. YC55]